MTTRGFKGNFSMTSPYGWRTLNGVKQFHNGVDFGMAIGQELTAWYDGIVRLAQSDKYGGKYIQIKRPNGEAYYDLHVKEFKVEVGDSVKEGDVIAISGNTGNSTGAHTHFGYQTKAEVWDSHTDPLPYLTLTDDDMLELQDRVEITKDTNMRFGNSINSKIAAVVKAGAVGRLADGPREADGYVWYDVYFEECSEISEYNHGWMANVDSSRFKKTEDIITCIDGSEKPVEPVEPIDPCDDIKKENTLLKMEVDILETENENLEKDIIAQENMLDSLEEDIAELEEELKNCKDIDEYSTDELLAQVVNNVRHVK